MRRLTFPALCLALALPACTTDGWPSSGAPSELPARTPATGRESLDDLASYDELLILDVTHGPEDLARRGLAVGREGWNAAGQPSAGFIYENSEESDESWGRVRVPVEPLDALRPADLPGCGGLVTTLDERVVAVPLEHTDVDALVQGPIASVRVKQRFTNPFARKIEALYVFPLPQNAAVYDFVMTIGERRIRGIVRERAEARAIYEAARAAGIAASLLTQERPNVFTQKVANIEPGKSIDVELEYFHGLRHVDGWYEFVFPMVVGPRFDPPGSSAGIGAVRAGAPGASGQPVEVPYLRPEERSGHDIALHLEVDAGATIEGFECKTHAIDRDATSDHLRLDLARGDRIPNKDFVFRYRVAGDRVKSALVVQDDYFLLTLHPPAELAALPRRPMEMLFVVDCSGSMDGEPLALVKRALRDALQRLDPADTFQIIRFSNGASELAEAPLLAKPANLARGLRYVDALRADGGTHMLRGVRAALGHPSDGGRPRVVTFMTDGYIGNEEEILRAIAQRHDTTRIFSFGVGSSVNRFLLEAMAREGDGIAAFIGLNDDPTETMRDYFARVSRPAAEALELDWGNARAHDVYPRALPDVFVGSPVTVVGRLSGGPPTVVARGRVDGAWRDVALARPATTALPRPGALPKVWARAYIADLTSQARAADEREREHCAARIRDVALEHGLLSAYTAFVAVDSLTRTEGGEPALAPVAVPVPAGVHYETTVGEGR
jgi:Ca-activated chloride channel family protein